MIPMNTAPRMNTRGLWSRILIIAGSIAMLVGALDPMEGSLVILPGSGLVAFGTFLGQTERRLIAYRVWVFILYLSRQHGYLPQAARLRWPPGL